MAADLVYKLYRNERQLPPLKKLPSETFFEHCMTGFEGDEAPPARLPEFYGDILCWSSDVYHHDGDDAWRAIETMQKSCHQLFRRSPFGGLVAWSRVRHRAC